ncbi:MAG: SDR family NAD(P)-dependent oxidoreductase [Pseudomonadota bacterium]
MQRALVIGSSGGIGAAMVRALSARGTAVDTLSRRDDGLDVTEPSSVTRLMGALDGPYELIFVATGQLSGAGRRPEKSIAEVSAEAIEAQVRINAIGPMIVLQQALRLVAKDSPSIFAALSARVGSIGDNRLGGWHSYRASKAALNMLIHGAALELRRTHPQACAVCLHPGTVATPFTAAYAKSHRTVPPDTAAANLLQVLDGLTPAQSGRFFDSTGAEIPW